jgi:fatty acyl-CoA reductase
MTAPPPSLDIYSCFAKKSVFFTGVTGFVGKVFLFKLLKEFPDLAAVYVLVRPKKNQTPQDRLNKEVLLSPCFQPLRDEIGEAEWKRRAALVIPCAGDILEDKLGLSEKDAAMITASTNFIVHLAATVDFMEKLNISIEMNVLGSMRVLALAHKCAKLEAMVHTSTCYVNWNRPGSAKPVLEQLYPLPFDPHEMCKHVLSLHPKFIPAESQRLLKKYNYPNTYTFTKTMGEHIIQKDKGSLPIVIVRPSIIGASWKEPVPGWVDALTAAGGLILTAGLGVVRDVHGVPSNVADIVPVDFVVNTILKALYKTMLNFKNVSATLHHTDPEPAAGAVAAAPVSQRVATILATTGAKGEEFPTLGSTAGQRVQQQQQQQQPGSASSLALATGSLRAPESIASDQANGAMLPFVFQSATSSSLNNLTWGMVRTTVVDYWSSKIHPKALVKSDVRLYESRLEYELTVLLKRQLPFLAMKAIAALPPPFGSDAKRQLLLRYGKALDRASDLNSQFFPFTTYQWIFDSGNTKNFLDKNLGEKASRAFGTDVFEINWYTYIELYSFGMMKYIMKNTDGRSMPTIPNSGAQLFTKASL